MSKWVEGIITERYHYTDNLFHLKIIADIAPFIAGQFTKLALTVADKTVQRAFSFVNPPNATELEFYVTKVPQGLLTPKLAQLQVGESIAVQQHAAGFFILDEIPTVNTLWMLATGTGISPYLSILQQPLSLSRFKKIILVHAVRYRQDLAYLPLMQQLVQQNRGKLQIATIVSREKEDNSLQGRIPNLIENGQLEHKVAEYFNPESSHVMLCGNPEMIQHTRDLLIQRHFRKHLRRKPGHITCEQYW